MRKRGLILIDTKYEFGLDDKGVLHVIDEVNTPDSSRLCTVEEWEAKYPKIAADGQNQTCLTNPPGSSNAFICKPANVAKFAAQYFANHCPQVAAALEASIAEKILKLEQADEQLQKKARTA